MHDMTLKSVRCISDVDLANWSLFAEHNYLLDPVHLLAVEQSGLGNFQPRYFQFFRHDLPVGLAVGAVRRLDLAKSCPKMLERLIQGSRFLYSNFLNLNQLELGIPCGGGIACAFSDHVNSDDYMAALSLLKRRNGGNPRAILFREFSGELHPLEDALEKSGFSMLYREPTTILPIRWLSFDEYLQRLRSRYRLFIRRNQRKMADAGISTRITSTMDLPPSIYWRLYSNVLEQQEVSAVSPIGPEYFEALERLRPPETCWFQYFADDKLIAFATSFRRADELHPNLVGMDYDECRPLKMYFNIFYDLIRYAVEHEMRLISFGTTAYAVKSAIGCSVIPQRVYLYHQNTLVQSFLVRLHRALYQFDGSNLRHAFKSETEQQLWQHKS